MALKLHANGYTECKKLLDDHKGKDVFVLFTGSVDPATGKSWCPDCVTADPVIEKCAASLKTDSVFIVCTVGERSYWKNQQNEFRTDPKLRVSSVPTLMKINSAQRLSEEECANEDLVSMLFEDE